MPYQWRRVLTLSSVAVALTVIGYASALARRSRSRSASSTRSLLLPLGFYLPAERARLRRLVPLGS